MVKWLNSAKWLSVPLRAKCLRVRVLLQTQGEVVTHKLTKLVGSV